MEGEVGGSFEGAPEVPLRQPGANNIFPFERLRAPLPREGVPTPNKEHLACPEALFRYRHTAVCDSGREEDIKEVPPDQHSYELGEFDPHWTLYHFTLPIIGTYIHYYVESFSRPQVFYPDLSFVGNFAETYI